MSTQAARAEVADALLSLGITNEPDKYDDGIHSWRCTHPDVYGRCTCFDEAVEEIAAIDWRVLGGVIPGPIPVEWVRVGDTIQDHGQITRITKHFGEVQLFLDDGYVSIVKKPQQDFVYVTGTNHLNGDQS